MKKILISRTKLIIVDHQRRKKKQTKISKWRTLIYQLKLKAAMKSLWRIILINVIQVKNLRKTSQTSSRTLKLQSLISLVPRKMVRKVSAIIQLSLIILMRNQSSNLMQASCRMRILSNRREPCKRSWKSSSKRSTRELLMPLKSKWGGIRKSSRCEKELNRRTKTNPI